MKIHIIITLLVITFTQAQDASIQPVVVSAVGEGEVLPQGNPQAEARAYQTSKPASNQKVDEFQENFDQLQDNIIQTEQRLEDKTQRERMAASLKPWIAQQFQAVHDLTDLITHEIFAFKLINEYEFRWNPSKKGIFRMVVEVFTYNKGQLNYPDKPDEDDHVTIMAQPQATNTFVDIGRVYLKRVFPLNFYTDYQTIRLKNNYDSIVLVQVSLELTNFVPETGVDDDQFKLSAEKIKSILKELEGTEVQREKMYKTEWSFRDREEQHQSEMLVLTGVELFVILGTAIVQMYCIKSLLDNRLIV